MNIELTDILTIVTTLGGFEAAKWGLNFYTNRKTNARIEDAHADVEEFKALREYNEFLQKQLENAGLEAYSPILVSFYDLLADLMDCYENWDFPSDSKKLAAMFNRLIRFERKINSV